MACLKKNLEYAHRKQSPIKEPVLVDSVGTYLEATPRPALSERFSMSVGQSSARRTAESGQGHS